MKHVYSPAEKYIKTGGAEGDLTPFLMSTAGGILGGAIIKELREKLADKKSPIPTIEEVLNSSKGYEGNIPLGLYQATAMASFSGYMGILSSLAKSGFDVAYKNKPQGAAFPLDETISNMMNTGSNYFSALINGDGDYYQMTQKAALDFLKENIQLARIANSWAAKADVIPGEKYKKEIAEKTRDLRAWKTTEGLPIIQQSVDESNPYLEINQKLFKQESDPAKAAGELPELIQSIVQRYGNNPEVLATKLQGLKTNNYKSLPSPENEPLAFARYIQQVRATQGPEAAQNLISDYLRKTAINRMKSSMVPSLSFK